MNHRDYKRIEAASSDEPRNKLNKSNGGLWGANLGQGCTPMKINIFGFLLVFMTIIHKNILIIMGK